MSGQLNTKLKSETLPLLLRVPEPSDAEALLQILNNPLNTEFDPHAGGATLQLVTVENIITRMRSSAAMEIPDRVNLVIVDTSLDNRVVGLGGFGHIARNSDESIGDAGVMLQPEVRGKGYGVESIKLALDYAFEGLKLNAVTLTMLKKNVAMCNLIDKKLKLQGIERESEFGTEICYTVQVEDWKDTVAAIQDPSRVGLETKMWLEDMPQLFILSVSHLQSTMLSRTFYNTFVKRNSVFIATIFATAFAFEVAFDTTSTRVWDNLNKGKQWKDIKDKYVQ